MTSTNQYEDIMPTLSASVGDARLKKKPATESQKATSRRFANLKDKVFGTISGPNENSDSEAKPDLPVRGHESQGHVESMPDSETDNYEIGQPTQQKPHRNTQKSIPIVVKSDLQKELSSVMDDRPDVPPKNHARPQVQHKLDNKRERESRKQNSSSQGQRQDQLEGIIIELQDELRKAKEEAFQAKEQASQEREIQEGLRAQLEELISHHKGQNHDSDKLNQQNVLLSKELSRAHEHLNRDQAYQTLISERRIAERNESIFKSQIKLLTQDMATLQNEAKRVIQELKVDVADARAELQRRLHESEDKVTQVQEQRDQVMNDRDRVRKELNRVVQQLASQTSLDVYHFDDTYFQSQFSLLRGNIKDWAHRAFSSSQFTSSQRRPSMVAEKALSAVSTQWELYIYADEHRPTIVQAFVWSYFMTKVFGGAWEWSKPEQPFGKLLDNYIETSDYPPENLQLYHEWRSTGARLAVPQGKEQSALEGFTPRLKATADTLQNYLEPWSTMGKAQSNAMLLKIIKEAVLLDLKMQQQRALFSLWGEKELRRQNNGLYDASAMEIRNGKAPDGKKEKFMELLIAPLLLKQGTSDGRSYSVKVILEKAQIDVAVPPMKLKERLKKIKDSSILYTLPSSEQDQSKYLA